MSKRRKKVVRSLVVNISHQLHLTNVEEGMYLGDEAQGLRRPERVNCRQGEGEGGKGGRLGSEECASGNGCAEKESRSRGTFGWPLANTSHIKMHPEMEIICGPFFSLSFFRHKQLRNTFPSFTMSPTSPFENTHRAYCQLQDGKEKKDNMILYFSNARDGKKTTNKITTSLRATLFV